MADYLLPIADREGLGWILHEQRTALAEHRAAEAARLGPGDRVVLYTTRGCFRTSIPRKSRPWTLRSTPAHDKTIASG